MNLLFYAPQMAPYGGMERHICLLAATAARRGHHVTLLTTSNSLGGELRSVLDAPLIELRELPRARGEAGLPAKLQWLGAEIARARGRSWDIVYTNGQSALARLVWLAGNGAARCIHHHHTAADGREQATWSPWFRQLLARAPELVACSEATRSALQTAVTRPRIVQLPYLTPCVVETAAVTQRPAEATLHFGYLGRLIREKGIDAICRLSADPALAGIRWHIHGAGPAYTPEYFRDWPRITYHGAYASAEAHARALLALDAIVLFSTHNEGLPLSLIEAMSAGRPWIATHRGGTRELALRDADAIVVPHPATHEALRAAVLEMAHRIRTGATSALAQRQAYDARYSPEVVSRRWLDYFETGNPT